MGKKAARLSETRTVVCCGFTWIESARMWVHLFTEGQTARATCFYNYFVNAHPFISAGSFITIQCATEMKLIRLKCASYCLPACEGSAVMTAVEFSSYCSSSLLLLASSVSTSVAWTSCRAVFWVVCTWTWQSPSPERGLQFLRFSCCVFDTRQAEEILFV